MPQAMRCEMVSWRRVERLAQNLALRIRGDGFAPDLIIAIGRGGWVPGRLLSDYLGVANLTEVKVEHYTATRKHKEARVRYPLGADPAGRRVLLVDDVTDTGDSFAAALAHIRAKGEPAALRTLVLHHKSVSPYVPDYYGAKVAKWRWIIYPWALVEDLTALMGGMPKRGADPEAIAERLRADHNLRVSAELVRDVLPFLR
jgi:hypoxanthine phosphoribosyltransferase